jgi:acyl dehydratase
VTITATYWDDLEVGQAFISSARTVTEADIVNYAGVTGDFNPLHVDEQWTAANTDYAGRIAHGLLVLGLSHGLRTAVLDELAVLAFLETTRRFRGPTYPGDTVHVRWRVADRRESRSRPTAGLVVIEAEVLNQHGVTVQHGSDTYLVARSPDGT